MADQERSIVITGGRFDRSVVSNGDVTQTNGADPAVSYEALRRALDEHAAELRALAGANAGETARDLARMTDQLDSGEPDPGVMRSGWKSVTTALSEAGAVAESVRKIGELVRTLFGA